METPKEQAIKAAYGEYWVGLSNEQQKYALENEGWIKVTPSQYQMDMFSRQKLNKNTHSVRPKCLTGIRNNNSWTRIESEEDMPKPKGVEDVLVITETGEITVENSMSLNDIEVRIYWLRTISHWQPFIKPNLPLY
ncbi:hypothetical protein [Elizabethkingia anophelis]|uniref:hypothetical protein n=1 Tax=Elizabethkingia anophelis TaxID=1117645 RepID=UPI00099AEEA3|nr:hypothetical protein [Elizabethkingia anophelis]OPC44639.1 hypothetical protein BAY05_14095 [Elizabethkingia anophelis]